MAFARQSRIDPLGVVLEIKVPGSLAIPSVVARIAPAVDQVSALALASSGVALGFFSRRRVVDDP